MRNRYRPIKSLGSGGFGKTYLAEDIEKLDEKCVIKQFAPQFQVTAGLQKATELFEQEARRLQQLGVHPQVPTLLAYFQEDSLLYLVQQFIDEQNLFKELEQQGTFSEGKIRDLLQDLLNILLVVHQQKVIHRDIKPENIIQREDAKVVLIDFGASKELKQTLMATQGTVIGSFPPCTCGTNAGRKSLSSQLFIEFGCNLLSFIKRDSSLATLAKTRLWLGCDLETAFARTSQSGIRANSG